MQMTQNSNHKWLQILAEEDFPPKLLLERERRLEILRQRRGRREQETAEQRENRLVQLRHRRQPQTCIEAATKSYYNYTTNETDEERKQ